jgi:iron complex outermembrane receptor protein
VRCFLGRVGAGLGVVLTLNAHAADDAAEVPADPPRYETVVVATTPLHGSRLPRDRVAANVQSATADAIDASHSLDLAEFMNGSLASVALNQVEENPLQADLQYRGFTASPVLGASQGMSVFLDGVRLNEPFGDVVNWDLIPTDAIRSVNLMPGSNPLFGLNTMGGALSLETKTGFDSTGAQAALSGGSFGRRLGELEVGGHGERWGAFGAARVFAEDGWRQHSSSRAVSGFGSVTYRRGDSFADLAVLGASTAMTGLGPAPVQLLAQDRTAAFTYPDETDNRMVTAILRGERPLSGTVRLAAATYLRASRSQTKNGDQDAWDRCAAPGPTGAVCAADGATVILDPAGNPVPYDPANPFTASVHGTSTRQIGLGGSLQGRLEAPLAGRENHLLVGASFDEGMVRFGSQTYLARLDDRRFTIGTDVLDPTSPVAVDGNVTTLGVYASDTFAPLPALFLTLSSRFNLSMQSLEDRLGGALGGEHTYQRLNPAVGLSYQPRPAVGGYVGYSESARAPTPMELTCANPAQPCRLPNDFLADPPLGQVVTRTLEAGVRGHLERPAAVVDYAVAAFRTASSDDILFVSAGPLTSQGYFANVGDTLRQGVEVVLRGRFVLGPRAGLLRWLANYTFLDATFRTPFVAPSPNHPLAVDGQLAVPAGAHLPRTPAHIGKASLTWSAPFGLSLGATVMGNGGQYYRGDEANLLPQIPGYLLLNLRADYTPVRWASAFIRVDNVANTRYATFGVLGNPTAVFPTFTDPRYQSPGAPRAAWLGVELDY